HCRVRALHSFPTRSSSDLAGNHPCDAVDLYADLRRSQHMACRVQRYLRMAQPERLAVLVGMKYLVLQSPLQDRQAGTGRVVFAQDRKSTRLNSSHVKISYA